MDSKRFNELIKRINFDEKSFTEIYKYYYPRVILVLIRLFGNYHFAEDIAQDFFGVKIFDIEITEYIEFPLNWFIKICRNMALNELAKENNLITLELKEETVAALSLNPRNDNIINEDILLSRKQNAEEYFTVLRQAGISERTISKFRTMDRQTVEIYIMYFFEGYSQKEIAQMMGMNYATLRSKINRGKIFLKNKILCNILPIFFCLI